MNAMKTSQIQSPDLVLAHLEWVRALSRTLVADAATADDLVQKAWLVAQRRAPDWAHGRARQGDEPTRARAWLGGILRNFARDEARRQARQSQREARQSLRRSEPEAPDELMARSELLAEVAKLVLELKEPLRRTMLLRYFEGLNPVDIAAREGVPSATVRTRIHRGVGELRQRLDARHGGGREGWALALMPCVDLRTESARSLASLAGGIAIVVGLAAATVAGSLWIADARRAAPDETSLPHDASALGADLNSGRAAVQAAESHGVELAVPALGESADTGRLAIAMSEESPQAQEPSVEADSPFVTAGQIKGSVVLRDGTPVPEFCFELTGLGDGPDPHRRRVRTSDDGSFLLGDVPEGRYTISADAITIVGSNVLGTGSQDHRIELDALIVDIEARDDHEAPLAFDSYQCATVARRGGGKVASDRQCTSLEPEFRYTEFLPTGCACVFSTESASGEQLTGFLADTWPSSRVTVMMRSETPEFGSLEVTLDQSQYVEGLRLTQVSGAHQTLDFELNSKKIRSDNSTLEYGALLPGRYRFEFAEVGDRFVGLRTPKVKVDIHAGVRERVYLESFVGGTVLLQVHAEPTPKGSKFVAVRTRRSGSNDWEQRQFKTQKGSWSLRDAKVLPNGSPGHSDPWEAGDYEVELQLYGYAPVKRTVSVLEEHAHRINVTFRRSSQNAQHQEEY